MAENTSDIIKLLASIKEDIHNSREESKDRGDKAEEQIHAINLRLDSVDKRLDDMDIVQRRADASDATFKYEFKKLERRLDERDAKVERRIKQQEEADKKILSVSETSLEQEATLGLAIGHIGKIEARLGQVEDKQDKSNEAMGAVVEELGIEGKVQLGRSLPPGEHRTPVLTKINKDNRTGIWASFGAALLIIVQIIWKILETHR